MKTNFVLSCLTLLIVAGLAEIFARLAGAGPKPLPAVTQVQAVPPEERMLFFRYHPVLGYDGIPNKTRDFWLKKVTLNSRGERSPEIEIAKPAGKKRVVLLGDSEVWGFGAADNETIGAFLQKKLGGSTEVVSLGNIGYSIDQQLLKFLIDGLQYSPDAAVVFFFGENDLWELASNSAWNVPKPRFVVRSGELCLTDIPVPRASGWPEASLESIFEQTGGGILSRSALWSWISSRQVKAGVVNFFGPAGVRSPSSAREIAVRLDQYLHCIDWQPATEPPLGERERPEMYLRLLAKLKDAARENRIQLYFAAVPRKSDFEAAKTDPDYAAVLNGAAKLGLDVVDLSALPQAAASRSTLFEYHGHTSPLGNQVMAEAIAAWF